MKNKITIKNNVKIIDNNYCQKKKNSNLFNTYNYLLSRAFDYFPEIVDEDNNYFYYKYVYDIDEPIEQKMLDLINLISLLHSKTTIYKEVDLDNYKDIYESLDSKISDTINYYQMLIDNIDTEVYMSPASYLIARNITLIFNALFYSKEMLDIWYKKVENKRKIRLVTIHNNLSLDHYLKSDKPYLVSWDKSKIDMPIYDIVSLYKNHYLDFDFNELLRIYFSKYPFKEEEMDLFLAIISIPDKVYKDVSNYKTILNIRRIIDYLYKSSLLVAEYGVKKQTNEG